MERRSAYWFDPTACEAIARTDHRPQADKTSTDHTPNVHQIAYQLAAEMFPSPYLISCRQIEQVATERRARRIEIQSIRKELERVSGERRQILVVRLEELNVQQSAARVVIQRFRGR